MVQILLLGANGQLGTEILNSKPEHVTIFQLTRDQWDMRGPIDKSIFENRSFDFILNTAAITNVDYCERHPEEANRVNNQSVCEMIELADGANTKIIQFSTDFVFDGNIPIGQSYDENMDVNPINTYGETKLAGEQALIKSHQNYAIYRVSSLYGKSGARAKGGNFVSKIVAMLSQGIKPKVVSDIFMSPTSALDVSNYLWNSILHSDNQGVFHAANTGQCSWFDFASEIAEISGYPRDSILSTKSDFTNIAKRPKNSSLSSVKINQMDTWRGALSRFMES